MDLKKKKEGLGVPIWKSLFLKNSACASYGESFCTLAARRTDRWIKREVQSQALAHCAWEFICSFVCNWPFKGFVWHHNNLFRINTLDLYICTFRLFSILLSILSAQNYLTIYNPPLNFPLRPKFMIVPLMLWDSPPF